MTALVSIPEVYRHLNLDESDLSYTAELQGFIDAATPIVEYICGPIDPKAVVETHSTPSGSSRLALRTVPVLSIQSVIEYVGTTAYPLTSQPPGSTTSQYGYSLDYPDAGVIVRRDSSGAPTCFSGQEVVVAYTAGRVGISKDIRLALLEDIRGLWQQTQQVGRPNFGGNGADDEWSSGGRVAINMFPRLRHLLEGPNRTQSIA